MMSYHPHSQSVANHSLHNSCNVFLLTVCSCSSSTETKCRFGDLLYLLLKYLRKTCPVLYETRTSLTLRLTTVRPKFQFEMFLTKSLAEQSWPIRLSIY